MNTVAEQKVARASAPFQKPLLRNDRRIRLLLLLPIVVVVAVFCFSPNFETAVDRETPFGGDFIQEWIGGHLIASGQASELYDLEAFRAAQHDAELLPFTWPEESYYPAVYPPFYYLVVSPLSALDYRIATFIWGVLSALAIVITAGLLIQYYPACHKYIGCWLAIALLFTPLLTCLNIGHKSTFLLLILTATFVLLRNKRPFAAGLAFAMIAFKPHLFVVVGLTMLIKRQWWFVAGNALMLTALLGLSMCVGLEVCRDYVNVLSGTTNYIHTGGYDLADAHSLWGAVQLALASQSVLVVNWVTVGSTLAVAACLAFILWGPMATDKPRFAFQFSAMVLATVLISPHMYFYDLTMLLLPLLLVFVATNSGPLKSTYHAKYLALMVAVFLIGAGSFRPFAQLMSIQPSVVLMIGLLLMIAFFVRESRRSKGSLKFRMVDAEDDVDVGEAFV